MSEPITVSISVGPEPRHKAYLMEAIQSVANQTVPADEVFIVDDMAGLTSEQLAEFGRLVHPATLNVWRTPWNLGNVGSGNCGVALARNECVVILASDDMLHPSCIRTCQETYNPEAYPLAYYWFDIDLIGKENYTMRIPSGPSMVTKTLWRATGGMPLESAVGHSDSFFMSIMQTRLPVTLVRVFLYGQDQPGLYVARLIDDNDRYIRLAGGWDTVIDAVKNLATQNWKAPQWGRYDNGQ